jgi:hypothetical protein
MFAGDKMKRPPIFAVAASLTLGLASVSSMAQPEKNFEERKTQHLKDIDEKILKMQEHRTCVSSAQSVDDLKKCKESMREFHNAEKVERMENRKKNIEKKLENLKK